MEILLILIAVAIAAVGIWVMYLIAQEFYKAAQAKGHSERKYFWICFLFGIVGYLLVVALPDRGNAPKTFSSELPDL